MTKQPTTDQPLHVGVACGGTGGHLFPGLATAGTLRQRGHRITLWMTGRDIESEALKGWDGPVRTVPARGFSRRVSLQALDAVWSLWQARRACAQMMAEDRPDALLAMGSYASAGPVGAALQLKVPVVLHEANVVPGKAVSFYARKAAAVAGSFEETRFYLKRKNIHITGMPLREDLAAGLKGPAVDGARPDAFTVLVMGGSRGARTLNRMVTEALCQLGQDGCDIQVFHLAGKEDLESVRTAYRENNIDAQVFDFVQTMAPLYRAADLAICRSGASTCAELAAFRVPSLLVPYPYAIRDHQMANARALEKIGAADVAAEQDLGVAWVLDYLNTCLRQPERLDRMRSAVRDLPGGPAADSLASLIEEVALGRRD